MVEYAQAVSESVKHLDKVQTASDVSRGSHRKAFKSQLKPARLDAQAYNEFRQFIAEFG